MQDQSIAARNMVLVKQRDSAMFMELETIEKSDPVILRFWLLSLNILVECIKETNYIVVMYTDSTCSRVEQTE